MKLIFSVFGNLFDPDIFTKLIDIEPTEFWIKGEKITHRKEILRQESAWEYEINMDTLFFEDITKEFEVLFASNVSAISEYVQQNKLTVKFDIIIEILGGQAPALYINKNFSSLTFRLDAEIDFDIYVL